MPGFFDKFPSTVYDGTTATNIIANIGLIPSLKSKMAVFYPYHINEGERADMIANAYYGDPGYSWLVWLSNDMIDTYYDWPLTQQEFGAHIDDKYGSMANAQATTLLYRVNAKTDNTLLTPGAYGGLQTSEKKYWSPILDINGSPSTYERKQLDWFVETNKVVSIPYTPVGANTFVIGDRVQQTNSTSVTAFGFIQTVNSSLMLVNKVTGDFANSTSMTNWANNTRGTSANVTTISTTIPSGETTYWEAVDAYTYEDELNESKRDIQLVDRNFVGQIEEEARRLLSS